MALPSTKNRGITSKLKTLMGGAAAAKEGKDKKPVDLWKEREKKTSSLPNMGAALLCEGGKKSALMMVIGKFRTIILEGSKGGVKNPLGRLNSGGTRGVPCERGGSPAGSKRKRT